ncbi:MAG: AgmX/PglI C-terminal domain-containing protein [Bdellovibrionota bacterium]
MSAVKRTWKLEYSQGTKNWTRIVRSEELKIGSRLGNNLRLPSPCPEHLLKVSHSSKGLDWETSSSKIQAKSHKGSIVLEWHKRTLIVSDITEDKKFQAITDKSIQIHRSSTLKDPTKKTLWFFYKGLLIETAALESNDPKVNPIAILGAGVKVEFDTYSRKLIVIWPSGDLKTLPLKNTDLGMEVSEGEYHFIISSAPDLSQLPVDVSEEKGNRMAPVIFTVMATFLILLAILQVNWNPNDGLLEEVIPEELAKLTIEKKSGLPGGGVGGGGVQTEKRDARGGAGIARPDEVLVKNLNIAASSGNLLNALTALDSKYTNQVAKAAIGPVGVGGPNAAQGILKSLGSMTGSGGGGVGIGGLGTKGFGGGGGGGNGLGFGTKTGNGVGEGKELRAISFESGSGEVRGGLEKSEVEAVIRQNLAQIRNCYNRGLRLNPTLSGKVKASFRIGANGKVDLSRIGDSTLASSDVEECIKGRILSWNFPQPRGGSTVDVSYPFLLRPQ